MIRFNISSPRQQALRQFAAPRIAICELGWANFPTQDNAGSAQPQAMKRLNSSKDKKRINIENNAMPNYPMFDVMAYFRNTYTSTLRSFSSR